jgi:TIR domain
MPFVEGYLRLARPSVHVFICHTSEDKAAARTVAAGMKRLGADVWFDEWEIRVGESIVQKIGDALGRVSHLVVLFSQQSVAKPWVQKEFSAALMRQLSRESIKVLPLRLDDCTIPPILADIKYADARHDMALAIAELERALFTTTDAAHE